MGGELDLPIAIRRHDIINPQLLADLLDPQMRDISVQLLGRHGRRDGCRQVHQAGGLVVRSITPPVPLATLLGAIRIELWLPGHRLWAAAAFGFVGAAAILLGPRPILISKATAVAQRDGVGARAACVVPPRHLGDGYAMGRSCCERQSLGELAKER